MPVLTQRLKAWGNCKPSLAQRLMTRGSYTVPRVPWLPYMCYSLCDYLYFCSFRLVPFLTELRAVMDWVWTDTTLSLSSWICVEDVYAHCFVLKCWRESEKVWPQLGVCSCICVTVAQFRWNGCVFKCVHFCVFVYRGTLSLGVRRRSGLWSMGWVAS